LIIHHLAVDAVSWRVLLEDLNIAWAQHHNGQPVALPAGGSSFQRWASLLSEHAHQPAAVEQADTWRQVAATPAALATLQPEIDTYASAGHLTASLDADTTRRLLGEAPAAFHAGIHDILLIAYALAWTEFLGADHAAIGIDVEGHGRHDDLADDIDLSRTVGWFTLLYPVALAFKEAERPGGALKAVKEQLRRVPGGGMSYGLLRYLSDGTEEMERLRVPGGPEVCFNYFGQLDNVIQQESLFSLSQKSKGAVRSQNENRQYLLEVNAGVASERLQLTWTYSENLYHHSTVENLAAGFIAALRSLITHCQSPDAGGHTPSDFPKAKLSQDNLNSLLAKMAQSKK